MRGYWPRLRRSLGLLISLGMLAACGTADEDAAPVQSEEEYQGLSREQIEAEATPMSPEEAERLGIVDTTIRLQPPMNPDSVVPLDSPVQQ